MAVHRLYRLKRNRAFTLAETVVSLMLTALAALFMLSAVSVAAEIISMSAKLRGDISLAEDVLYKQSAEYIMLRPEVRVELSSTYRYEDMTEHPYLKVYRLEDADSGMVLLYYSGEYSNGEIS